MFRGVRPSSGAETQGNPVRFGQSDPLELADVAAAEDGRTPLNTCKTQPRRAGGVQRLRLCPTPPAFDLPRLVLCTAAVLSAMRPRLLIAPSPTERLTLNCPVPSFVRPRIEREGKKFQPVPTDVRSLIQ